MSNARQKRARSPVQDVAIPAEDCTRDTFDQHANLSDRQFLCWALQTEARVRFAKLEGRDRTGGESTTLNSEYLLDLYPATGDEKGGGGKLARERYTYGRKSLSYLQNMRNPDSSFETLTRLTIDQPQSKDLAKKTTREGTDYLPIPPNQLYFEIILEAFMGYRVPSFHSEDPTQPRAAIMGGAVVAALTAWRDEEVLSIFEEQETAIQEALLADDKEKYHSAKEEMRLSLHRYFLHEYHDDRATRKEIQNVTFSNSPFSMGDVDIFLQASPLTQSLMKKMQDLPIEVREIVCSNLGGSGFVHQDLQAYAASLCGDCLEPQFKRPVLGRYPPHEQKERKFCYALTVNGLSFALGCAFYPGDGFDPATQRWPRTTQLIMLNEKADIVGGLMDFDISVVSCSFDGVGVYVTPRAAFSLKTMTQVVTPFVYEEKRNRSRIKKYYQRGFDAYVIDPFCLHDEQCVNEDGLIAMQSHAERNGDESDNENDLDTELSEAAGSDMGIQLMAWHDAAWKSSEFQSREAIANIERAQEDDGGMIGDLICAQDGLFDHRGVWYSAALIEKSRGHATEYFAKRDNWSEEERNEVLALPEHQRFVCRNCRNDYSLGVVLEQTPAILKSLSNVEDVLHGDYSYHHSVDSTFRPTFYNGGAFNSIFVGKHARTYDELVMAMLSQQKLEGARFLLQHGSSEGDCRERFVYGGELESVFNDAANKNLSPSGRAPVGLNPERFIAKCKGCQKWLHECEFGVEYCERCEDSKPAAIND